MPTMFPILTGERQKRAGAFKLQGTTEFGHVSASSNHPVLWGTQFDTCQTHNDAIFLKCCPVPRPRRAFLLSGSSTSTLSTTWSNGCCQVNFIGRMLRMGSTDKLETRLASH